MPCDVQLPKVSVRNGEVTMTCFPWTLQKLSGKFVYNVEPDELTISDLRCQHDSTQISGVGSGWFPENKPWKLEFKKLNVDGLRPDDVFRNVLPGFLQASFDFLQPKGDFSFSGPISFFGPTRDNNSIGVVWKLDTVLSHCSIRAGAPIDDINGKITLLGRWNGNDATINGTLDLDSLWIFRSPSNQGYQITAVRGPISYGDRKFVAGNLSAVPPRESNSPDDSKRIQGRFIDGTLFLDSEVILAEQPQYRAFVELKGGKLEDFARQYLRRQSGLAGVTNGWINLHGKGMDAHRMTGEGKIVISPAALYNSPLLLQVFDMFSLKNPDKAAFYNAEVNFTVGGGRFDLNRIEMQGDTLSMGGRGFVRFDGAIQADFGVYLRQWFPNPSPFTAIKVTGNVGEPKIKTIPLAALDETVRQIIDAFTPRRMPLFGPRTGQKTDKDTKDVERNYR
jgi:hypothetical protein